MIHLSYLGLYRASHIASSAVSTAGRMAMARRSTPSLLTLSSLFRAVRLHTAFATEFYSIRRLHFNTCYFPSVEQQALPERGISRSSLDLDDMEREVWKGTLSYYVDLHRKPFTPKLNINPKCLKKESILLM